MIFNIIITKNRQEREVGSIAEAHEGMIWTLSWHPLGHILASGSNDHST